MAAPRSDNVKEIILAKTSELMEETGLSAISLASIAEACGISKGTLYYHYKTKEDIFFDLIDKIIHRIRGLYFFKIKTVVRIFDFCF